MARIKLRDGIDTKSLGHAIFELSSHKSRNPNDQAGIEALKDNIVKNMLELPSGTNVEFVFDESNKLYIIVPDLSGKTRTQPLDAGFDLSDFAAEAMGFIVITGCGE